MKWVLHVLVALVVLGLLTPMFATARHVAVIDPNDTRGALDIRRVEIKRGTPRKWKVTSWGEWKVEALWDRGFTLVYVDTFGGNRADYYALVRSNGRELIGTLRRDTKRGRDRKIRTIRVGRPNGSSLTVAIPFGSLRTRDSGLFRWYTLTLLSGDRCRRVCFDRAPNSGQVLEPAPQPTPSVPTPTPTPSP